MNKDQIRGKFDQATGKAKEKAGEAVGNQKLANRGAVDQVKGAAEETWGNVKEAVHDDAERNRRENEQHAKKTRNMAVNTVNDVKDRIDAKIDEHEERERLRKPA